ncbi:hypothetical protein ACFVP8_21825 [Viridibacillus arvi]|uniref:hypothetical protein n=1 Tax=Viridibacillus arvi TaxID=263475 RepID=UPI0036B030AB
MLVVVEITTGRFLKQAFLKLYIYRTLEYIKGYGLQYLTNLHKEFSVFEYKSSHAESIWSLTRYL